MKSKIYFLVCFALLAFQGQSQWNRIDSITHGSINSINFINADTGFVYAQPGVIWRTANGGQAWDSIPLNFTGYLHDMAFANPSVGYAVGGAWFPHGVHYPYAIYKTTDAGLSWDSIHVGGTGGVFNYVATVSDMEFFATSQEGMLHSDDGGLTYDTASVSNLPWGTEQYTRIRFLDANEGYVLARSNSFVGHLFKMFKTIDGGGSWQSIHEDTASNFALDFVMTSSGNGLIVGNDSYVLRTTNGGNSWQKVTMSDSSFFIHQIEEVDGHIYGLGSDSDDSTSVLFYSPDWGSSWQKQFSTKWTTGGLVDFSIPSSNAGYFATWREVYKNEQLISIPELQNGGFEIYPNPASDFLSIKLNENGLAPYSIYNIHGQIVLEGVLGNEGESQIPVGELKSGVYVLEVFQGKQRVNKRFVKE